MNAKGKGSQFERQICTTLSQWWTQHLATPRTDVFWRTAMSGGRATVRAKRDNSLTTFGGYGDITAVDPIGQPLLDLMVFELKRGYKNATIHDLLDKTDGAAKQEMEKWVEQAEESQRQAGSFSWAIVHRRNHREPLLWMPSQLQRELATLQPILTMRFRSESKERELSCFLFDHFLQSIHANFIRELAKRL